MIPPAISNARLFGVYLPTALSPLLPKHHDPPPDRALCDLPVARTVDDIHNLYYKFMDSFVRQVTGLPKPPTPSAKKAPTKKRKREDANPEAESPSKKAKLGAA